MIRIKKGAYTICTTVGKDRYVINMRRIDNIKQFDSKGKITMLLPIEDIIYIIANGKYYGILDLVNVCIGAYCSGKTQGMNGFAIETKNKIIISRTIQSETK